jgi:hypothetical protein
MSRALARGFFYIVNGCRPPGDMWRAAAGGGVGDDGVE